MKELRSKVLEMWRLVHLYKFLLTLVIYFGISFGLFAAAITHKNWAIFKVADQIYFFNDLDSLYSDIDAYKCSMPDSILFKVIKLNLKKDEKKIIRDASEKLADQAPFDPALINIWKELKIFLKIENYISSQKVVMVPGLEKQIISLAKSSSCNLGTKQMSIITRLVKAEIFLKSRFSQKSVWITDEEVKKIQASNTASKLSLAEIKEKELERKVSESIELFIKTLERQIPHEDFW